VKNRVAVIGGGVAGISAAYHLRADADITLFDANDRFGGHANTIEVVEDGRTIGMDTAFVVFNAPSYPQLSAFFKELDVPIVDHKGGFNFFDLETGVQYGTREFELSEEAVTARYPTEFVQVWREAKRFYEQAPRDFIRHRADVPLGTYLDTNGYSEEFKHGFVVLLGTAVWSLPAELIWELPASTFIAFFMAHDRGGLGGESVDWKTVGGGSISYVRRALDAIGARRELANKILNLRADDDGVTVSARSGNHRFDYAIVATHADEALAMLAEPGVAGGYLEKVKYNQTRAVLHTDPSIMSPDRSRWLSWNYGRAMYGGKPATFCVYYMNHLQSFTAKNDYFVSVDCPLDIRADSIIRDIAYTHPIISLDVREMQRDIYRINDEPSRIKLCGSYFHSKRLGPDQIGSHEAAFASGAEAARAVKQQMEVAQAIPSA
jgi:predicted NAD/FAD-binding protein